MTGSVKSLPAATACLSCRSRKTKCDKQHPSCSQCVNAGWSCPGYKAPLQFLHADKRNLCKDKKRREGVFQVRCPAAIARSSSATAAKPCAIQTPQYTEVDKLRLLLISQMRESDGSAISTFLPSHTFLHYVPVRIGASSALDDAVRCISLATSGTNASTEIGRYAILPRYIKALNSLQNAILSQKNSSAMETVAAVMLLQLFEQFTSKLSTGWIRHAGGAAKLLELRGPRLTDEDIGLALLESQVGRINLECIRTEKESFLAQPEWQALFRGLALSQPRGSGRVSSMEWEYHRITSHLPGLLQTYIRWQLGVPAEVGDETEPNDCARSLFLDLKNSLQYDLMQFWKDLRLWKDANVDHLTYEDAFVDNNTCASLDNAFESPSFTLRNRLAFNCLWPSFTIITAHMLLQVRYERILGSRQQYQQSVAADEIVFSYGHKDVYVSDLVEDCLECRERVVNAFKCMLIKFPIPAGLIRDSLIILWRRATEVRLRTTRTFDDPVIQALGSLW